MVILAVVHVISARVVALVAYVMGSRSVNLPYQFVLLAA